MGGVCSCLGKRQHASQDGDLDSILGSDQISYGATDSFDYAHAQPDEQELQRERDALEHITVNATDHMIDVLHPNESNFNHTHTTAPGTVHSNGGQGQHMGEAESDTQDADEDAWLASIAGLGTAVRPPQKHTLVLDVAQLRQGAPQQKQPNF
ncbi:uncharacterized protein RCC_08525 [Ramularia collo-cygni]|uniref:Uncharacterized protein n=1 Tax=Ramularia collo-cygni TaxID=112498 RepID=A0A2D3VI03_9PEZI|nr:uncharacterized protein RCC_08525 [Ramularia collo-cygni]CZT22819.1 uncharacterized protein RCC_08525 [Ramularia collo-cygni]